LAACMERNPFDTLMLTDEPRNSHCQKPQCCESRARMRIVSLPIFSSIWDEFDCARSSTRGGVRPHILAPGLPFREHLGCAENGERHGARHHECRLEPTFRSVRHTAKISFDFLQVRATHSCRLLERGQSNLKCGRKWPGEGSRPSPQSPKGILGFPPPDDGLRRTQKTKVNALNRNDLVQGFCVKSPRR